MELFFGFVNTGFGILFCLLGFKIYNPFKGKNLPEQEKEWYVKYGTFMKIGGMVLLCSGIYSIVHTIMR